MNMIRPLLQYGARTAARLVFAHGVSGLTAIKLVKRPIENGNVVRSYCGRTGLALYELVHIRISVFSCRQVACRY
jgi:hypothetical protein